MEKIYLQDILPLEKYRKKGKVLLVRHYHEKLAEMVEKDVIFEYQSYQEQKGFQSCKYMISFLGGDKNSATFYGAYKVKSIKYHPHIPEVTADLRPFFHYKTHSNVIYMNLQELPEFRKYKDRLMIDWFVPRGWYNEFGKVKNKEVKKILPFNYVSDFPGLMSILVSFSELKKIIDNPDSHGQWYEALTRLQAVYLIFDKINGRQYIGTTYGEKGLWQRWQSYVSGDFTGGNKMFKEMKQNDPDFYKNFQFSILEVLPKTAYQKLCMEKEKLWKQKLGTNSFGLNRN